MSDIIYNNYFICVAFLFEHELRMMQFLFLFLVTGFLDVDLIVANKEW